MDLPSKLLAAFPPSPDHLLNCTRRPIDDAMLQEIASADYGLDAPEHLRELQQIRNTGVIMGPLRWIPGEVLQLISWSDPENPAHKPGSVGVRGHQMRAFACAVLLRAVNADNESYDQVREPTLARCLGSARVLGEATSEAAARFLTWRIPRMPAGDADSMLFIGGLLIVATRLRSQRIEDHILGDLAEAFLAEEAAAARLNPGMPPIESSLGVQQGYWQPLAEELLQEAAAIPTAAIREQLELLGTFLRYPWYS